MTKQLNLWAFVLVIFALSSCSAYEDVEFLGVEKYGFSQMEDSQIKASITFKINNPNFYSIKLKKSDFEIYIDNDLLGNASMLDDMKIEKKKEGDYVLDLAIQENDLKKTIVPLLKKAFAKKTVTFRVKGQAHAKVWGVLGKKFDINEKEEVSITELINKFKSTN